MEIVPLGDSALIVRVRDRFEDAPDKTLDTVLDVLHRLEDARIPGVIELTPAYTIVAIFFDPLQVAKASKAPDEVFDWLAEQIRVALSSTKAVHGRRGAADPSRAIEIPVCYDPEFALDIGDVAQRANISPSEVIRLHGAGEYRVACIGFVPGFPFLAGLPKQLSTPRRATPRKKISAGSVGIGGGQTGIYPLRSPGGWNLIGRTPFRLFDPEKNPPTLLRAGDRVHFRAITREKFHIAINEPSSRTKSRDPVATPAILPRDSSTSVGMTATVQRAGFLTSVQDLGRTGYRQFGVSLGGALDAFGLRVTNLLVGNHESAAGLEITFGGLQLRFIDERIVAWCGGEFDVRIGSMPLPAGHAARLQPSEELKFGQSQIGCRSWLAISGGVDVPVVLGSRSTDLRAQFGGFEGRTLRDGDLLPLGEFRRSQTAATAKISSVSAPHDWVSPAKPSPTLRFSRGVDWNRFNASTLQRLSAEPFVVSPDSDRMGVRFDSPELQRRDAGDLISEAVSPGTIQVPPSGKPILLLGDCQTIGGYPKIAHVITVDLGIAAQLRAGDQVRFSEISLADAHRLLLERENELKRFRIGLSLHDP
jgi:antagonist of KipI